MLNEDFIKDFHVLLRNTDQPQQILDFINSNDINEDTRKYVDALIFLLKGDFISLKKSFDSIEITKEDEESVYVRKIYNFLLFKIKYLFNKEEDFLEELNRYLKNPPHEIFYALRNAVQEKQDPLKVLNIGYNFKLLMFDTPLNEFKKIKYINLYNALKEELRNQ